MYKAVYTSHALSILMSSFGWGKCQRTMRQEIEKRQFLTLWDVARIYYGKKVADPWEVVLNGYADSIPNISAIYRLMDSLEKQGHVAVLLQQRPRVWYSVTWKAGVPFINDNGKGAVFIDKQIRTRDHYRIRVHRPAIGYYDFKERAEVWQVDKPGDPPKRIKL